VINRLLSVIYIVFCFEVGIFLILFPWFTVWENNVIVHRYPLIKEVVLNGYVRGAITGLGISNLILGVLEVVQFRKDLRSHRESH
jgi:hypothetical protein